eukprot:CAMPEP_0169066194 /NCGR_PEP_ID=MMETSP1015-20121227/2820_1 /TAXON_ID=342587 /ORGANISM="Karlodinium micrum, Strain CCMP2283" /LENGTH=137 /DNA_ID=CAMNT_0009124845 /DNA_START=45 /DNA_END=458 /DNA_ORIENTATION=+
MQASDLFLLFVAIASGSRIKLRPVGRDHCGKFEVKDMCPFEISTHVLKTITDRSEEELRCIEEVCDKKGDEDGQCCKVKSAFIEQLESDLTGDHSEEALVKIRASLIPLISPDHSVVIEEFEGESPHVICLESHKCT